jgi:hypothetical protein
MYGNQNGYGFQREDLGPGLITAGLSMLANNDGRRNVPQLIGQGGLDAIAGLQFRKQMEAQQARQQMLDERAQAQHDMQMQKGQFELDEANRKADLMKRWQAGDMGAYKALFPEQWAADQRQARGFKNALELEALKQGAKASQPDYLPLDATGRRELSGLSQLDSSVNYLEDAIEKAFTADEYGFTHGGTGLVQGALPNWARTRFDPHGNELRSAVSNFSSQLMNYLSGAAVSEQERVRLEGFLPTVYDNKETLLAKLEGYRDYVRGKGEGWKNVYGDHAAFGRMRTFNPKEKPKKEKEDIPPLPDGFVED